MNIVSSDLLTHLSSIVPNTVANITRCSEKLSVLPQYRAYSLPLSEHSELEDRLIASTHTMWTVPQETSSEHSDVQPKQPKAAVSSYERRRQQRNAEKSFEKCDDVDSLQNALPRCALCAKYVFFLFEFLLGCIISGF
jgi:hypothetical protein